MDDQRGSQPDESRPKDTAEGVRIIGADEAAEAMERDDVAPRRTDDELRYGDRPPAPPAGPRPALRFPLDASADPTRIERPPVEPAPDPVTGPVSLPHWTEPPTGEVPAVLIGDDAPLMGEDEDDLDVWSSFATSTPRWRDADDDWGDDGFVEKLASEQSGEVAVGALGNQDAEPSHEEYFGFDDMEERVEERTGDPGVPTDPGPRWEVGDDDWSASADPPVGAEPDDTWTEDDQWVDDGYEDEHLEPGYAPAGAGGGDRNMPMAIGVGLGLAAVGVIAFLLGSAATTVLVTLILAACAVEYFEVLRKVGWESARVVGLAAVVAFPLAVHWKGLAAYPLVAFLVVVTILSWYVVGAGGRDPRVLEGTGATLLGVIWIGGLGSSATYLAGMTKGISLLLVAVAATVAYDVGGLFIGKAMGHRPLSSASPNKTVEGLIGGMACALLVPIILVGMADVGPWEGFSAGLLLGVGAAIAAPLGDLCQSVLKRDLGVKDMGSLLPGHGGVLDRFDAMLFVLPTVLWLTLAFGPLNVV
ncbi:phosphatidate cytidylyltransferase [Aquihabitans daechungensis]|uniref:phosphatidate cytidylyltransferase n=1 Tax=Aquihabitans daechungensis TaxID=1052257 RepID=UPI003BA27E1B